MLMNKEPKTSKTFRMVALAGVVTGVVLEPKGFGAISEVFEHLFPGIYTLGIAAMADTAAAEVRRQVPALGTYIDGHSLAGVSTDGLGDWCRWLVAEVGESAAIVGPMDVTKAQAAECFGRLRKA
jgi:hypothetical protein